MPANDEEPHGILDEWCQRLSNVYMLYHGTQYINQDIRPQETTDYFQNVFKIQPL